MIVGISPGRAEGHVNAPPSKSMAHRMLIASGLSDGECTVENLSASEDILATADCLKALGKTVEFDGSTAVLNGRIGDFPDTGEPLVLPVRESGSTLRFFIPAALTLGREVRFTGATRLFERPLSVYEEIAAAEGFTFERGENSLLVKGSLKAKDYRIRGDISSQFVSGLLFALPGLSGDSRIILIPPVESRPYIDMTMQALKLFGIETAWEDDYTIRIPGGQKGKARRVRVEGDYSNAAFLSALNLAGGNVEVDGLLPDSLQGDRVYAEYFAALENGAAELDISDCPDLGPVLFAAAAMLHGGTFTGTARLRIKESDRAAAMEEELAKFGVHCVNEENRFLVEAPETLRKPAEILQGHNDHRIVMALSTLLTLTGGEINGAEAVRKSYPDYFDTIRKLGIKAEEKYAAVDQ